MILVTGGTGFVGAHVVRALLRRGEAVRCLVRPVSSGRNLASLDVERMGGDLADASSVRAAMQGCDVVFHCAADYRLGAPRPEELYRSNVLGTRHVLAAAAELGVRRVVYTSTVGAVGLRGDGTPSDERDEARLEDMPGAYKRTKYLAEQEALGWARQGVPVVIVNPSTPVGELDVKPTPTGQIVLDFLRGRMPAYVDTGLNLVDVRDVAEGHLLAAERGKVGERYILGCRNLSLKEILQILAFLSGRRAPSFAVPHWVPWIAAAACEPIAWLTGRATQLSLESVRMSRHWMYFDSSKAVRELGLPQSSVEEALGRAARWFADEGYLAR